MDEYEKEMKHRKMLRRFEIQHGVERFLAAIGAFTLLVIIVGIVKWLICD